MSNYSLNGDELEEYLDLQHFVLLGSNITRVPGNFLALAPNMKFLNLRANRIQHVGEGLIDHLQSLQQVYFSQNICINMNAGTSAQIQTLIEALRVQCRDIVTTTLISTTSTTFLTTSTSNQPPRCEIDDLENFVCGLDEENQYLRGEINELSIKNEAFESEINNLKDENQEMREKMDNQAEELKTQAEELQILIVYVEELALKVQELSSRPCTC